MTAQCRQRGHTPTPIPLCICRKARHCLSATVTWRHRRKTPGTTAEGGVRAQLGGDPAWPFFVLTLIVFSAVLSMAFAQGIGLNNSTESPGPHPAPTVEKTNETTTFTIASGPEPAAADWTFPAEIRFDRVQNKSWVTVWNATADEGETVEPHLTPGERYRVTLEDAAGRERVMGALIYEKGMGNTLIEIYPCCADVFSWVESADRFNTEGDGDSS